MSKRTRRSDLREAIFLILFRADCYDITEMTGQIKEFFRDEEEFRENEIDYVYHKVLNICEKIPEIDKQLDAVSVGWKVRRMNQTDLTVLRLAYYEICYDDSVPVAAAIDEAVELAKNYGTENSGSFVNGILAKVAVNAGK